MDPKLLDWAGGDIEKVNLDPKHAAELRMRYASTIIAD
jgi:hypothetical protein